MAFNSGAISDLDIWSQLADQQAQDNQASGYYNSLRRQNSADMNYWNQAANYWAQRQKDLPANVVNLDGSQALPDRANPLMPSQATIQPRFDPDKTYRNSGQPGMYLPNRWEGDVPDQQAAADQGYHPQLRYSPGYPSGAIEATYNPGFTNWGQPMVNPAYIKWWQAQNPPMQQMWKESQGQQSAQAPWMTSEGANLELIRQQAAQAEKQLQARQAAQAQSQATWGPEGIAEKLRPGGNLAARVLTAGAAPQLPPFYPQSSDYQDWRQIMKTPEYQQSPSLFHNLWDAALRPYSVGGSVDPRVNLRQSVQTYFPG